MKHPNLSDLRSAAEDGFDAMPIVSASQCWYTCTRDHPDQDAKMLATVAKRLASLLEKVIPDACADKLSTRQSVSRCCLEFLGR